MNNFRNKLIKFMYGRYGTDQLYKGIFGMVILLLILNLFIGSTIISSVSTLLLILATYRVFSKNIYRRQKENAQYLKLMAPLKKSFRLTSKRLKDIKSYRYRKCPNCKKTLRLKRKVGSHKTVCPKCGTKMDVRILF